MSVRDTAHTNPDSLRLLYKNPKNPLRDLEDDVTAIAQSIVVTSPASPPSGGYGGGQGGGGGGGGGGGCPAVGMFTLTLGHGPIETIRYELVQNLRPYVDWLWNPILQVYDMVTRAEIVKDVECVAVKTTDLCEKIVSRTHPVIQSLADKNGTSINELLSDLEADHNAVSVIMFDTAETQIDTIRSVGLRDVVHITLQRWGIYPIGKDPYKTILGHNKRELGGGNG
jgi:hypothetical protein